MDTNRTKTIIDEVDHEIFVKFLKVKKIRNYFSNFIRRESSIDNLLIKEKEIDENSLGTIFRIEITGVDKEIRKTQKKIQKLILSIEQKEIATELCVLKRKYFSF